MLRTLDLFLSPSPSLGRRLRRLLALWLGRRRQRLALQELDARLLEDVGLTPRQAVQEAAKPFWRV